ncbi:MAG: dTMP kinase [Betaproteobacteria bacterium]|nr:dTMP kinase [Betaproteobacteria bacterium]
MTGRFVTLEGIDGAGKSSFIGWIEGRLRAKGVDVVVTREPGGTAVGEELRRLVLNAEIDPVSEALLLFAARKEHLVRLVVPALKRGAWVVCDRFTDATFAYQGAGRGVDTERLAMLEGWIQAGLRPDCTILFELPVAVARARSAGARAPDRFESEQQAFFERVRQGYLARAARDPDRFRIIDASLSMAEIEAQLAAIDWLR